MSALLWRGTQPPVVMSARVDAPDPTVVDFVQVELRDRNGVIVRTILVSVWDEQ